MKLFFLNFVCNTIIQNKSQEICLLSFKKENQVSWTLIKLALNNEKMSCLNPSRTLKKKLNFFCCLTGSKCSKFSRKKQSEWKVFQQKVCTMHFSKLPLKSFSLTSVADFSVNYSICQHRSTQNIRFVFFSKFMVIFSSDEDFSPRHAQCDFRKHFMKQSLNTHNLSTADFSPSMEFTAARFCPRVS